MTHIKEAFIYLWYDAYNKMYYLGKHKGTPDDSYTHSSKSSEKFCSIVPHSTRPINERKEFFKNMPKGVTRRILAYGTDEEMCILEHKLLVNRKERCWDRYYNESLGDPRYVDQSGKNNPMYGKTHTPETKQKMSEAKITHGRSVGAKNDPKINAQVCKEWRASMTPEERTASDKKHNDKTRASMTPEELKAFHKKKNAKHRAKKKAEKEKERGGVGTLEPLLT